MGGALSSGQPALNPAEKEKIDKLCQDSLQVLESNDVSKSLQKWNTLFPDSDGKITTAKQMKLALEEFNVLNLLMKDCEPVACFVLRGGALLDSICEAALKAWDLNHDGSVDFREFLLVTTVLLRPHSFSEPKQYFIYNFNLYDADSDGFLSKEEIFNYRSKALRLSMLLYLAAVREGCSHTAEEAAKSETEKSHADFYRAIPDIVEKTLDILIGNDRIRKQVEALFQVADSDGDGKVSPDEFVRLCTAVNKNDQFNEVFVLKDQNVFHHMREDIIHAFSHSVDSYYKAHPTEVRPTEDAEQLQQKLKEVANVFVETTIAFLDDSSSLVFSKIDS